MKKKKLQLGGHKKGSPILGYSVVDDEDYKFLSQFKWFSHKQGNGFFYATQSLLAGKIRQVHRLVLERKIGRALKRGEVVDHINHDTLDNRRVNLRVATRSQNCANVRSRAGSSSKYLGVCWNKKDKRWKAQIRIKGTKIYLGHFVDEMEAAKMYDKAALDHHGEFANLNFKNYD